MKINSFYKFESELRRQAIRVYMARDEFTLYMRSIENLLYGEYKKFQFPITFIYDHGNKWYDMIETGSVLLKIISENMKEIFEKENFTGWKTFPIKIFNKKGEEIQGYYGFSVVGKSGPVDYSKCQLLERPHRILAGKTERICKGFYVDIDKWDGSDFFLPEGNSGIIVSKRVAEAIKRNKFTNVELTNLLDWELPEYLLKDKM